MTDSALADGLAGLAELLDARLSSHLHGEPAVVDTAACNPRLLPDLAGGRLLTTDEYVIVLLALAPHIQPDLLSGAIARHLPEGGDLPELGGVRGVNHRGLLPTGETAQFLLAGDDLVERLRVQRLLSGEHWLAQRHTLWLDAVPAGEPVMSGRLVLDPEIVELIATGSVSLPRFSSDFPAERIETDLEWDDVVLNADTRCRVHEIENWIRFNDVVGSDWGMDRRVKPGYRALFHGPPGTGKTLTATLLGKVTAQPVFRIDLSRVVSKYIGETEKSLARLFDRAANKSWILFFDEADALFGKRTDVRDAHDKYANQEVAYLLQRIENHPGLVVLATNQRGSIDDAFLRRFQTSVHFPLPGPADRYDLWMRAFPHQVAVADDIDWREIAGRFELTGAGIVNVAHYCAIELLASGTLAVDRRFLESAVVRELVKEGKLV